MKSLPSIRQGDSFRLDLAFLDKAGDPIEPTVVRCAYFYPGSCGPGDLMNYFNVTLNGSTATVEASPEETANLLVTGVETLSPARLFIVATYADGFIDSTEDLSLTILPGGANA